jgi:hypothetical protein
MINIDFEQAYREAIVEVLAVAPDDAAQIPSLPDLMIAIRQGVECEQLPSDTFEMFFDWWDTFTAYDQLDEGINAENHRPILKVAYEALKASGYM